MTYPISVIGHRGAAAYRLENTIDGYGLALELGCDAIELDVRLSRDDVPYCHHDDELNNNYASVNGRYLSRRHERQLKKLHSHDLDRYRLGPVKLSSPYQATHPSLVVSRPQRIPRFREALRFLRRRSDHVEALIEIKLPARIPADSPAVTNLAQRIVTVVGEEDFIERSIICGFHWAVLRAVRDREPKLRIWHSSGHVERKLALLEFGQLRGLAASNAARLQKLYAAGTPYWFDGHCPADYGGSYADAIAAAGGDGWFSRFDDLTPESVAAAHERGLSVAAWTVNQESAIRKVAGLGVDAICSDYPDRLVAFRDGG